mmetsp:Transcript_68790/g.201482  ORF Transcript_68790/g.201482 Transcript_68790/m.201482 type:complete len:116 (+) Transcript_68790:390-737(+)
MGVHHQGNGWRIRMLNKIWHLQMGQPLAPRSVNHQVVAAAWTRTRTIQLRHALQQSQVRNAQRPEKTLMSHQILLVVMFRLCSSKLTFQLVKNRRRNLSSHHVTLHGAEHQRERN